VLFFFFHLLEFYLFIYYLCDLISLVLLVLQEVPIVVSVEGQGVMQSLIDSFLDLLILV